MKKLLTTLMVLMIGVGISSTGFTGNLLDSHRYVPGEIVSIDRGSRDITLMTDSDSVYKTFHVAPGDMAKLRVGDKIKVLKDFDSNKASSIVR